MTVELGPGLPDRGWAYGNDERSGAGRPKSCPAHWEAALWLEEFDNELARRRLRAGCVRGRGFMDLSLKHCGHGRFRPCITALNGDPGK